MTAYRSPTTVSRPSIPHERGPRRRIAPCCGCGSSAGCEADVDGRSVEPPASRRAWSLLAWLALHPGEHPAARSPRASGPTCSTRARAPRCAAPPGRCGARSVPRARTSSWPAADRVGLRCATDLPEFDALVAAGALEAAAALHRGPLLADLDEDWVLEARDEQTARLGAVLARLAAAAPTAGARGRARAPAAGARPARRGRRARPDAHHAAAGDRAGALAVLRPAVRAPAHAARPGAVGRDARAAAVARGSQRPRRSRPRRRAASPVVGRDAELAALLADAASAGRRRGARRRGRDRQDAAGARAARARRRRGRPHGALRGARARRRAAVRLWVELLRDLARELAPPPPDADWPEELAGIAPSLPRRLGRAPWRAAAGRAGARARAAVRGGGGAVEHAGADRPLVLLLDDVHLADAPSLELAAYVARRISGLGVLLVLTRRTTPQRRRGRRARCAPASAAVAELLELDVAAACRAPTSSGSSRRRPSSPPEQRAR